MTYTEDRQQPLAVKVPLRVAAVRNLSDSRNASSVFAWKAASVIGLGFAHEAGEKTAAQLLKSIGQHKVIGITADDARSFADALYELADQLDKG